MILHNTLLRTYIGPSSINPDPYTKIRPVSLILATDRHPNTYHLYIINHKAVRPTHINNYYFNIILNGA